MKTYILPLLLILLSLTGFSKSAAYEYTGRNTLSVKKEKLGQVQTINDLSPQLWQRLILSNKEREELERRRKTEYSVGCYLYPQGGYATVIDYVSIEISATLNGKVLTAKSTGVQLTAAQKNILNAVDSDTDISIRIAFKYKNFVDENLDVDREIKQGWITVTVVPETEAEYPGGFSQLSSYLTTSVFNKLSGKAVHDIGFVTVKFTVNEQGQVVNARIFKTSGNFETDKLVIDAITKMPGWKAAKNSKGINVKQTFSIPFGAEGGC